MQLKFLIYLQKFEVFKRIEADTKWAYFTDFPLYFLMKILVFRFRLHWTFIRKINNKLTLV